MAGAPARKTPVASNPKLPITAAVVQVGEPRFAANPSEKGWTAKNPVDVTTMEKGLPPVGIPMPVQFEATVYVPVRESVAITPPWDAVVSPANVPVAESNLIRLTAAAAGAPLLSVPSCRNP
jgi:hypothetical protein